MPAIDTEDDKQTGETQPQDMPTLSGPIIGIIYPPPEVRSILFSVQKSQKFNQQK